MGMILVVDDDAMTLKLVEHTLVGGGHEAVVTANPQEAAHLAAAHQVDAVILDVIMPGRSGFEVLKDLHANPETRSLPVLMLSALGEAEDRVKGLRGGADEYLGKPFDPEELLLRLNRLIDGRFSQRLDFQGRLETLSIAEVVQSLLHCETNGMLEVGSGDRRGTLVVAAGRPISATWGRLENIEAVLAMMDLKSGTFQFVGRANPDVKKGKIGEIPIQTVMFTAAWLADELSRWPAVGENIPLSVLPGITEPPDPEGEWGAVPVRAVFDEIAAKSGISILGLQAIERWSPKPIALAVRFLVQSGVVVTETAQTRIEDDGQSLVKSCTAAVDSVIDAVGSSGFSRELPHILILVEPSVYAVFLEVRQALPTENLAVSGESITAAWRGGRIATLALRGSSSDLALHVASLDSTGALKQLRARMADYPVVMAWVGDAEKLGDLGWIFEWVEMAPSDHRGILVASGDDVIGPAEQALKTKNRWRIHARSITGMEDLLGVIAEG